MSRVADVKQPDHHSGADSNSVHQHNGRETPPAAQGSIRVQTVCPETLLVARLNDGSYVLMSYPQREPAALVAGKDAEDLHSALHRLFNNPEDDTADNHNTAVAPGNAIPSTATVQP